MSERIEREEMDDGGMMLRASRILLGLTLVGWLAGAQLLAPRARAESSPAEAAASQAGAQAATPEAAGRIGFIGHNLFGSAHGVFHVWRVVEHRVDLADPTASQAVVEVTLASVDTKTKGRDDHLRTPDFFDVEKFPVATVRGHSPKALPPGPAGRPRYAVKFDVDLHGVTKTLDGEVEIVESSPVVVEGGFTIMRSDFGVGEAPSSWNPMSIDDEVPVRFRVRF
ncbi:MAG: YceI family protein [Deltaproteobacteria bacterium]|nr:YceI family protein [Deltaproteobacteria bacterium]